MDCSEVTNIQYCFHARMPWGLIRKIRKGRRLLFGFGFLFMLLRLWSTFVWQLSSTLCVPSALEVCAV